MKAYWDSSALVESTSDIALRRRLRADGGYSLTHSLAECFSALTTGGLGIRQDAASAALSVENLAKELSFVDLTPEEVLDALKDARAKGVCGGRVHDLLHAIAAEKSGARELLTLDQNDFSNLTTKVTISQV